jgi:hypothetical protein
LARRFHTSDTTIHFIVTERTWKHVLPHIIPIFSRSREAEPKGLYETAGSFWPK